MSTPAGTTAGVKTAQGSLNAINYTRVLRLMYK